MDSYKRGGAIDSEGRGGGFVAMTARALQSFVGSLILSASAMACSGDASRPAHVEEDAGQTPTGDAGVEELDGGDAAANVDAGQLPSTATAWFNSKVISLKDVDMVVLRDGTVRGKAFTVPEELQRKGPFRAVDSNLGSYCMLDENGTFVCSASVCTTPPAGAGYTDVALSVRAVLGLSPEGAVTTALCGKVEGVFPEQNGYVQIKAREYIECALHRSGRIDCAVGFVAGSVSLEGAYVDLAVGINHICGLAEDGTVTCSGPDGQPAESPQATPPEGEKFVRIAAGARITCGIRAADRSAACWGRQPLADNPGPFVELAVDGSHACGIRPDGEVICWGSGDQFKDLIARLE